MESDHLEPWARLPGERQLWYRRFMRYRDLGTSRSVAATWRSEQEEREAKGIKGRGKRPSRHWYHHATVDLWESRAEQFDAAESARIETQWRERRSALREQEFTMAERLLQRGKEILEALTDSASWSLSDAIRAIDLGSKIGRLASQLSTELVEVHHHQADKRLTEDERIGRVSEILRQAAIRKDENSEGDDENEEA